MKYIFGAVCLVLVSSCVYGAYKLGETKGFRNGLEPSLNYAMVLRECQVKNDSRCLEEQTKAYSHITSIGGKSYKEVGFMKNSWFVTQIEKYQEWYEKQP